MISIWLNRTLFLLFLNYIFLFSAIKTNAQEIHCDHTIALETEFINGLETSPGDTICIESGYRSSLYFGNIRGTNENPLVIINHNGIANIESEIGYGISFSNCQHFIITGSGSSDKYGIQISSVPNGSGMKIGNLSSDIEISRLEISNTKYTGITAKSDPTCSFASVRDSFTMYNTHIHNNYLHDIGTEGLYIGNSFYLGVNLSDCDTTALPHLLDGVDIHHNIVENTGWDGIQLGCALYNSQIHHNRISFDSQEEKVYQMSGIMVNPGSSADVYNNTILNGKGTGIALQTTGGQMIYNNLIINSGQGYEMENQTTKQKFGIYSKFKANVGNDSSYKICNNTIINPKSDGIRFQNRNSSSNLFQNNIIINPGAFDYYEDNGNTSNTGIDSYINLYYDEIDNVMSHNIMERSSEVLNFVDPSQNNYQIFANSPAYNSGENLSYLEIITDINDVSRPQGNEYDIGAYESNDTLFIHSIKDNSDLINVFPNPSSQNITIQLDANYKINCIFIYNSLEVIMGQYKTDSNSYTVRIQDLPTGSYYILVSTEGGSVFRKKFIKL